MNEERKRQIEQELIRNRQKIQKLWQRLPQTPNPYPGVQGGSPAGTESGTKIVPEFELPPSISGTQPDQQSGFA